MRISVDAERCAGSGLCVLTDPELFDQNETDGRVRLLVERPPAGFDATVREAVGICPSRAITLVED